MHPLAPLGEEDAAQLAAALLGTEDDQTAARIGARSGGNPLFIEEEVAVLRAAGRGAQPRVSATVRGLIAARIDRLAEAEKAALEALAVLGEPAAEPLVRAALAVEDVSRPLAAITATGLARFEGLGAAGRWTCRHALYQEVAYLGMTLARRRVMHARAAVALEAGGGAQPETVARHARLGEDWARALAFSREAGRRAALRNANRAAVTFFSDALEALDHLPESEDTLRLAVDLRFDLRNPLFRLGPIGELRARLEEAGAPAERLGDPGRLGQLHVFMSHHAWLAGDYAGALAAAARAEALAEETADAALALRAVFQRGLAHLGLGDFSRAAEEMAEVAAHAEDPALGGRYGLDAPLTATALAYRVRALADAGRLEEGWDALKRAVAKAEAVRVPFTWIFVRIAEGVLLLRGVDPAAACVALREAARLCDEAEAELMRPVALGYLGAAEAACGALAEGAALLERAISLAAAMGFLFQQDVREALLCQIRRRQHAERTSIAAEA